MNVVVWIAMIFAGVTWLRPGIASPLTVSRNGGPAWLQRHGYTRWDSYRSESRFWHFQLVEGAAYLVLAAVLAGTAVWLLRRRAA
jgi:hypothetical protein